LTVEQSRTTKKEDLLQNTAEVLILDHYTVSNHSGALKFRLEFRVFVRFLIFLYRQKTVHNRFKSCRAAHRATVESPAGTGTGSYHVSQSKLLIAVSQAS